MHLRKTWVRILLIAWLMPMLFPWHASSEAAAPVAHFPAVQATSLNSAKLHLPQDFSGQLNLVILSFAREQQHDVDTWIPAAKEIQAKHEKFRYYELPVLSGENFLYRWWFDESLRNNTDRDMRSQILTAYVNKRRFLNALQLPNEKQIVAVLVDRAGKIYWRANGAYTIQDKLTLLPVLEANQV